MSGRGDSRGRSFRGGPERGGRGRGGDSPRGEFRGGRGAGDYMSGSRGGGDFREGGGRGGTGPGVWTGPLIFGTPQDVSTADHDPLVQAMKTLTISSTEPSLPLRPGSGTIGTPVRLRANHFPLTANKSLYEYKVDFEPKVDKSKRIRKRIYELLEASSTFARYHGQVAHDSASKLISAVKFPSDETEVQISYFDADESGPSQRARTYKVTARFIRVIEKQDIANYIGGNLQYHNYNIQPIISALNIVLGRFPNRKGIPVGRNKLFFNDTTFDLGAGLEGRKGFFTSVRPAYKQLMVNVNVAVAAFYKGNRNLIDAMIEFKDASKDGNMSAFVWGVQVETRHLGYKQKKAVQRLHQKTARQESFHCEEFGKRLTVEEYFRQKYQITLQYADWPLVDLGNKTKAVFVPPELCFILPDQPFRGRLLDKQTASVILWACRPPAENATNIMTKGLPSLGYGPPPPPTPPPPNPLAAFGISIKREMAVVPGRVLPAPKVLYGSGSLNVQSASWNMRNVKFKIGADLGKWAVLLITAGGEGEFSGTTDPELRRLATNFANMCRKSGMTAQFPPNSAHARLPGGDDRTRSQSLAAIRAAIVSLPRDTSIILVVLSSGDRQIYAGIKKLCDTNLDVRTVCVQSSKLRKDSPQYYANVALKFNMKLGGMNHSLEAGAQVWFEKVKEPVMLVGADVTHPGPGSLKGTPSIAAVVGTVDRNMGQYPCSLKIQKSKEEMIMDLKEMMIERLSAFQEKVNTLPSRVLFFRDGVSEGQFLKVVTDELPEIQAAFAHFSTPRAAYKPKLTIAIAGKRHHTRFYPVSAEMADGKGNPQPGTVVDRGVTSIYNFDFFLQAHAGLQGTTKPTHYNVVYDENTFNADEIQTLTHNTSYMFQRATKAVSLIPPSYYADLACERGRCYISALLNAVDDASTAASASSRTTEEEEGRVFELAKRLWGGGVGPRLRETMFYL